MINTRCCYYCKWRQRERKIKKLLCVKYDREVSKDTICAFWKWRWGDKPTEEEFIAEQNK